MDFQMLENEIIPALESNGITEPNILNPMVSDKDDYYVEKQKIKKRRSSLGKGVLSKPIGFRISEEFLENYDNAQDNFNNQEIPHSDQVELTNHSKKIQLYINQTKQLKQESEVWKSLLRSRSTQKTQAKSEYQEAKNGDIVIEEEDVRPTLSRELSSILATKPNYSQYLQEVKRAEEEIALTSLAIEKYTCKSSTIQDLGKMMSNACYSALEREALGPLNDVPITRLLSSLQKS